MKQNATALLLLILLASPLLTQDIVKRYLQEGEPDPPACPTFCECGFGTSGSSRVLQGLDNNGSVCTGCINNNYYFTPMAGNVAAKCTENPKFALSANADGLPTQCQVGYYIDTPKKGCCPLNCDCASNNGVCTACSSAALALNYVFANMACTYTPANPACPANCLCTSGATCAGCKSTYGFITVGQDCQACPANCAECSSSTVCTTCKTGFKASGNNCVACDPTCATCNPSTGVCETCFSRHYKSGQNCTKCAEGCLGCNSGTTCEKGCALKYYAASPPNKVCEPCGNGCSYCVNKDYCTTCSSGFFKEPVTQNTNKCTPCLANCAKCENTTKCQSCKFLYELKENDTRCDFIKLSTAAIIGIVIGAVGAVVILIGVWCYCKKKAVTQVVAAAK